ncbi:MAG: HAD-IC family P-type ATPase [Thermoanaerobaculales bacterium]
MSALGLEVPRSGPAESSDCGLDLGLRTVAAVSREDEDLLNIRRRFWVSAAATAPLLILTLSVRLGGAAFDGSAARTMAEFMLMALATPVVLWGAWPLLVAGWRSITRGKPTMLALVGVTVAAAYLYGVIATLFPEILSTFSRVPNRQPDVFFLVAAVVTFFALLGRLLALDGGKRMSMAIRVQKTGQLANLDHGGRNTSSPRSGQVVVAVRRRRASLQALPDAAVIVLVAATVLTAATTFIVWSIWGPEPAIAYAFVNTMGVLIIACPCALGLARPVPFVVAASKAADAGILFESAAAIEAMQKVDTLVIGKTGVLTEGCPQLVTVAATSTSSDLGFLRLAASLEQASEHPLASAIVAGARERGLELFETGRLESIPGMGVHGTVGKNSVVVGNQTLVESRAALSENAVTRADHLGADGQTVMFVAVDGVVVGLLGAVDPVKKDVPEVVRQLRAEGMQVVLITGDRCATAEAIARPLGIDQVEAEVRPDQKAEVVRRIQGQGKTVAVACDAVDDAPVMAVADVGIELSAGADGTTRSAGVTPTRGDLRKVVRARRLSRATTSNIRGNLRFALIYSGLGLPIAAGVLYPVFGLLLSPVIALAAMSLGSLSVIGNALRLRRRDPAAS